MSFFRLTPRKLFTVCLVTSAWLSAWGVPAFGENLELLLMPGEVIKGHAKWEEQCSKCHKRFDKAAQDGLCQDCHKDIATDMLQKKGVHGIGFFHKTCHECHTEHQGRQATIAPLNPSTFDHAKTNFPLNDAHAKTTVQCQHCHLPGIKYRKASSSCLACHKKQDVHKGKLGPACANCHTEREWKQVKFDHRKTRFPLRGKHQPIPCKKCHEGQRFKDTPRACASCHRKDDYHWGVFGRKCAACHTEQDWAISSFDHNRATKFLLKGKHIRLKCESCHKVRVAKAKTPSACLACHRKDDTHKGTFGKNCSTCHTEQDWKTLLFDHDRDTRFLLKGKHQDTACVACHKGPLYSTKVGTACLACHKKDDVHKKALGPKCANCHDEKNWKTTSFNHDRQSRFPLKGKHRPLKCVACHANQQFKPTATNCDACHTKDDVHKGQEGQACEKCHNEQTWKETTFDHGLTRFPLLGKHQIVSCESCHRTQEFKNAETPCVACHSKDDVHKLRLGPQCQSCHNARNWKLWDFDHNRRTHFPLDGGHKGLACLACHTEPTEKKIETPDTCIGCHSPDDVHEGDFGLQCARCHFTSSWERLKRNARIPR